MLQPLNETPKIPTLDPPSCRFVLAYLRSEIDSDFYTIAQAAGCSEFRYSQVYAAIQYGLAAGLVGSVIHAGQPTRYFFKNRQSSIKNRQ